MCDQPESVLVYVPIPADLACSGKAYWKWAKIDACIAPLVDALNKGGVYTRSSCCAHGRGLGGIVMEDQSELIILPADVARRWRAFAGNPQMQAAVLVIAEHGLRL